MRGIRSSSSRNDNVRSKVNQSRKENGFMLKHMASKVSISTTSISTWRTGNMNFIDEKLDAIETFLKRYED